MEPDEHDLAAAKRSMPRLHRLPADGPAAVEGRRPVRFGDSLHLADARPARRRAAASIDALLGFYSFDAGATFVEAHGTRSSRPTTWR